MRKKNASISTYANYVSKKDTPVISAQTRALQEALNLRARQPGWVHNLMWSVLDLSISHTALWIENAAPLPSIPAEDFCDVEAINTILCHLKLFKIVTPINVPCFKELLVHQANQPLVDSVVHGFTFSFWPFAHTQYRIYSTTVDDSGQPPKSPM